MHHSEYADNVCSCFSVAISHYSPNVFETSYKHVSLPKKEEHKWNVQVDNLKPGNQQVGIYWCF